MRLKNRVVLITGGASGIGRAIALRFCREGAHVVIGDITTEVLEGGTPTHEIATAEGLSCSWLRCDVSDEADCEAAIAQTIARHGRIDVLVNNAVARLGKPLLDVSRAEWDRMMAVGLTGVFMMTKAAVRAMVGQTPPEGGLPDVRGRIVNISSQHGMVASPEDIAYGTAKAGVVYMTRQVAVDYAKAGIVCNAVAPGKIMTGKGGRAIEPRWVDYSHSRTPWPRLGTPEDVAGSALFLASDDAAYVTGHNLLVDGGWMAF
ncbi:SDR family NAD(P)-dependent oxidoreductase [Humitalea sp. 24SJ18S-53]|uniref:SDR family NAD(P)-dependent oxidoreductase n=1 Tax=Humitalea sp. 24SJ18S-53 TaxID=3422307 RepID=UPI003D67F57F